jgi:hypothetical protein
MLTILQSHPLALFALLAVLALAALPLARAGTLGLRSWRARRVLARQTAAARAVGASLDVLTALAATLVLSAEAEVRDLKDPLTPGSWSPAVDGPRFLARVVGDLRDLGGSSLVQLRALQGLSVDGVTKLLERVAEAQVQKLRATPPAAAAVRAAPPALGERVLPRTTIAPPETIRPERFDPSLTQDVTQAAASVRTLTAATPANDPQQGSIDLRGMLVAVAVGIPVLALLALLSAVGCIPARRFVLDHTAGVPARVQCTPRSQVCARTDAGLYLPSVYSDECRAWPTLPRRPDGTQRTCAAGEGCALDDAGIAGCTAAEDGGAR